MVSLPDKWESSLVALPTTCDQYYSLSKFLLVSLDFLHQLPAIDVNYNKKLLILKVHE